MWITSRKKIDKFCEYDIMGLKEDKMKINRGGLWFFILTVLVAMLLIFIISFFIIKPKVDRQLEQRGAITQLIKS